MPVTVLILGGCGFFGSRIASTLASDRDINLLIGSRDSGSARALAMSLGLSDAHGIEVDPFDAALTNRLRDLRVGLVIHAAGPYQGQDYRVAWAAIEAGVHYADLADGRAFVNGIVELDSFARERGVLATSGASSVPALSAAVVDRHSPRFGRLDSVHSGITSSGRTPGLATMRSVFGYCGKTFTRLEDGAWRNVHGWMGLRSHMFPPPVGRRWLADCDVPDLDLFPRRYPTVSSVTFQAGLASTLAHWAVWAGAAAVRWGLVRSLMPAAALLRRASHAFEPWVSTDSAMFVEMAGVAPDGAPLTLTWHLVAERGEGPFIPCGATIALAQKIARGDTLPIGATPCAGIIDVDEYLGALSGRAVREVRPLATGEASFAATGQSGRRSI